MQPYLFAPDGVDYLADPDLPSVDTLTLADARPYQVGWADQVMQVWQHYPTALGVAATGIGKTWLAALLARRVLDGELDPVVPYNGRAVLFIAHRVGLVDQAATAFSALLPDTFVEIEQGQQRARGDGGVICASLQSLRPSRLRGIGNDRVQAVIWDEAHRYGPRNKVLRRVLEFFGGSVRHLGVTATPDRGDGVGLGNVFRHIAFDYGIWQAVEDGWLVPPHLAYEVSGDVKLEGVPLGEDGDFEANAIAARMMEAGPIGATVKAAIKWSNYANGREGKRQVVVCCASVDHAKLCTIALNEWHKHSGTGRAAAVCHIDDQDRADVFRAYEAGEIRYLCHFDVLTEGWDSDRPKVMINGRPTTKRWVFGQNAGRILRPDRGIRKALAAASDATTRKMLIRNSPKPGAMIVDVAGTSHKLTVDLASVFHAPDTGAAEIAEVRRIALERAERGEPSNPTADYAALRKIREQQRAERWSGVRIECELDTRMSDPFDVLAVGPTSEPPWVRGRRPSEKQMTVLLNSGIPAGDVNRMTFWDAKRMLEVIFDRRNRGLCSYKQVKLLRDFGIDGANMTFDEAGIEIDTIKANGWQRPDGVA